MFRSVGDRNGLPLPQGQSKVRLLCSTQGVLIVGHEQASPASMAFLHRTRGYKEQGTPQAYARVVVVVVLVVVVVVDVVLVVVVLVVLVVLVAVVDVVVIMVVDVEVVLVVVVVMFVDVRVVVLVVEVVVVTLKGK